MKLTKSYLESLSKNELDYFLIRYGLQYKRYPKKSDKIAAILMAYIKHNKHKTKEKPKKLKETKNVIKNKTNVMTMNNVLLENKNNYRVLISGNQETWIKTEDLSNLLQEPTSIFFGIKTTHFPNGKIEQNVNIKQTYFRLSIPFNALISIDDVRKIFKTPSRFAKFKLIKTDTMIGELLSVNIWYYGGSAIGAYHGHDYLYKLIKV